MASPVPNLSSTEDCEGHWWSYRPAKTSKYNYTWIIDSFSLEASNMSSGYLPNSSDAIKWYLNLYMNNIDTTNNEGYYSLYIYLEATSVNPLPMMYTFSLINARGEKVRNMSSNGLIKTSPRNNYGISTFITKRDLLINKEELLPDDRLTISCEVKIIEIGTQIKGKCAKVNFNVPKSILHDDLNNMFNNKKYCDVEFTVGPNGQVKFQAHKAVLAARSSVFLAMFDSEMEESKNNQPKATDFSPDIFHEMLRFVYTDKVEGLDGIAKDLLIIADYYNLDRLKKMCEESLYKTLSIENAADIYIFADKYNANTLKVHTVNFANRYAGEFFKTAGYLSMKEKHSKLAAEIAETLNSNPVICPIVSDINHLLLQAELSDVTLVIGDEELPAHKVILAKQSPVFLETFKTSTTPNRIVIADIQSDVMKEVLAYLYKEDFCKSNDTDVLLKVLAVAETYGIEKLKTLCAKRLEKNLSVDTVVSILIEAEDYDVVELLKKALDFIQNNKKKVMCLDNFKELCAKKPELLFKILQLDTQK